MPTDVWDYWRSFWEEPAYRTADHSNSPSVDWAAIRRIVLHYSGRADNPDGDPDELPMEPHVRERIRATQRYYINERGYPIGYQGKSEQLEGTLWECRGEDFMCAANKGVNSTSVALQIMVDGQDEATPAAIRGVHQFVRWAERKAGRVLDIVGHLDVGDTECPGVGVTRQIRAGVFRPPPERNIMEPVVPPRRIIDTRLTGGRFTAGLTRRIQTDVRGAAVMVNLTAVSTDNPGFLTAWGGGIRPEVSNLNWDGPIGAIANTALVPLDADGTIQIFTLSAADVIVDLQGVLPVAD